MHYPKINFKSVVSSNADISSESEVSSVSDVINETVVLYGSSVAEVNSGQ